MITIPSGVVKLQGLATGLSLGATYTFFSHAQRGAVLGNATTDALTAGATSLGARVTPNIQLKVTPLLGGATGVPSAVQSIAAPVQLYGPGDVSGFDARHVIRTEPLNLAANFEPNYFPCLEFDDPGVPWLFTPAVPTTAPHPYLAATGAASISTDARLRPWIVLVVLADAEFVLGSDPLHPSITVATATSLPDLGDSWAWAHVQVYGDMGQSTLDQVWADDPGRVCSRLVCPRNLQPETHYTAFLVPAFDAGCLAALGKAPSPPAATVSPAWKAGNAKINLPYFHKFEFRTSDSGDFETLVRRLQPRALSGAGTRPMATDIADTYWNTPAATSSTSELNLGGALTVADSAVLPQTMLADVSPAFMTAVAALINNARPPSSNPNDPDPMVVPPLYGRWQAGVASVMPGPGWLNELNLDPRWRVAAGLGAKVVIGERDKLVAAAWDQIGPVQRANQLLVQGQMARGALGQSFARKFLSRGSSALLALTSPVHTRILPPGNATTVAGQLQNTFLPPRILAAHARKSLRARGPIARAAGQASGNALTVSTLVQRVSGSGGPYTAFAKFVIAQPIWPGPTFKAADTTGLAGTLRSSLLPSTTVVKSVLSRIGSLPPGWAPKDPLEPIMAAPAIDFPMSLPLAALDERNFLPGVESIPPESLGALESNQPFIEAYMVGLNFELGRQLLWNRYPTDQRGTYFRQFWDAQGYQPPGSTATPTAEQLYDISSIDRWQVNSELGTHPNPDSIIPADAVVLLIRGELLHRYPHTIISAQAALFSSDATDGQPTHMPDPNGKRLTPIFRGSLSPDITYLGFDLTPTEARGNDKEPGWFFVFQNHPREPRFGLDGLSSSASLLTPGGFAGIAAGLGTVGTAPSGATTSNNVPMQIISGVAGPGSAMRQRLLLNTQAGGATAPPAPWGQNAAAMAGLLFREPVRVFVHAGLLLPAAHLINVPPGLGKPGLGGATKLRPVAGKS